MKKIVATVLSCIISFSAYAANNKNILYYVDGLYSNSEDVKNVISQNVTGLGNSCGPTSLLFVNNHFSVEQTGINPEFTSSKSSAISELEKIYSDLPGASNNTVTDLDELKAIAKSWGWTNVRRRYATDSIDENANKLIIDLDNNKPGLVVLDSNFSRNPTTNIHSIDHIVIVYAYQKRRDSSGRSASSPYNDHQNDRFYFYDPYYGGKSYFTRGEISEAVNLTGFAYLQVAP